MSLEDTYRQTSDPRVFARAVKAADRVELESLMRGERRAPMLDKIFRDMSSVFRADRAKNLDAVLHWNVGDRPDGGIDTYELVIAEGKCRLSPAPEHKPRLALTIGAVELLRLVTGNANPLLLFMKGKLRASGDLGVLSTVAGMFDVPKP